MESKIKNAFEQISPSNTQKETILKNVLNPKKISPKKHTREKVFIGISAAVAVLTLILYLVPIYPAPNVAFALSVSDEEDGRIKIMDHYRERKNYTSKVSNVNSRPSLEFYIEGKDIAEIELTCENEYLYVVDWTKTQEEKFWNPEVYQTFDEATQRSTFYPERLYDKTVKLTFSKEFNDYDQIWYRWTAWDLYTWAAEDNFSKFQGVGVAEKKELSQKERLNIASGDNGTANGHILLEGYPKEKLQDKILMKITDHEGNVEIRTIYINIINNEIGQTVVNAEFQTVVNAELK